MEYHCLSNEALALFIEKMRKRTYRICWWWSLSFLVFMTLAYLSKPMEVLLFIGVIILAGGTIAYGLYNGLRSFSKDLNKLVAEVRFMDGQLVFKTFAFSGPLLVNRPSIEIKASPDQLIIKPSKFPLKSLFGADDRILKVNYQSTQLFIVVKYFDSELESRLKNRL